MICAATYAATGGLSMAWLRCIGSHHLSHNPHKGVSRNRFFDKAPVAEARMSFSDANRPVRKLARGGIMDIWAFTKLAVATAVMSTTGFEAGASGTDLAQGLDVDVALVFAVDFSSSIDPATADLQRNGHAAALKSPEIMKALSSNPRGCIAISYFEWASPQSIKPVLPWTRICGPEDAEAAAGVISSKGDTGLGRRIRGGTSISSAIAIGSLLLDRFPGHADRMVIDISGNGENNDGMPVQQARARAIDKGYTINAIAVPSTEFQNPDRPLASYFAEEVIGGSQAFVIVPKESSDYTTALRRKLVTEISWNLEPNSPQQNHQPRMMTASVRW
jgi:hypothetical protein